MSHVSDLLRGLAQFTATAGLVTYRADGSSYLAGETALMFKNMPSDPDRVAVLAAYGANGDQPETPLGRQPVQVKTRGLPGDPFDVEQLGDAIFDLWHGATNLTFGAVHVVQILRTSSASLGMDAQSRRWIRVDNYDLDLDYPTTPNRPI